MSIHLPLVRSNLKMYFSNEVMITGVFCCQGIVERGNLVSADETKILLSKIISRQRLKKTLV